MALLSSVRAQIRQLRYPREFRIRAEAWPGDVLAAFERTLAGESPAGASPEPADAPEDTFPGPSLADVVTSIWRLERRLRRLPGDTRTVTRHLEAAWDTLTQAGVKIQDHLDDPFDPGLSIKVLSYQPAPDLDRERVVETIRPSVYLNDQVIQRGEVIVGTPDPVAKEEAAP
ncbi:hypothetical protein DP939_30415 [Spongiactinospora rosea]|uniref:Nucleotide exchange factor GrpE n=1 Tax=Spongiactinospora rosea TaxID=2248750 RepID=A0A366LSJ6_9ACTN|nr:hypothetical protein [Spongiactinospora rosea]RBQ16284.1 hypothetical protein DP939_30415 [Spongiactinospora rosea]